MILSAIVLLNNPLFSEKYTLINLGGPHYYEMDQQDHNFQERAIFLTRKVNISFIKGFYNYGDTKQIENLSAIVGGNGAGKTTILNSIRQDTNFGDHQNWQNSILIFEDPNNGNIYTNHYQENLYEDKIEKTIYNSDHLKPHFLIHVTENEKKLNISQIDSNTIRSIYYSPHITYHYDRNKSDDRYDISISKNIIDDLEGFGNRDGRENGTNYHPYEEIIYYNMERQLQFLNSDIALNSVISDTFKLPKYNSAAIIIRKYTRNSSPHNLPYEFQQVFTKIYKRIEQERGDFKELRSRENGVEKNTIGIEKHFLKLYILESFMSVLEEQFEKENTYLEEGEVNDIESIENSNKSAFQLIKLFLQNARVDGEIIFNSDSSIKLINVLFDCIDQINNENYVTRVSFVTSIDNISKILTLQRKLLVDLYNYYPKYENNLIDNDNYIKSFIHYSPSQENLSSGQHALLNLFSNLHYFVLKNLNEESQSIEVPNNFLILLDEADLGFHPLWKKKYIKVLAKSMHLFFDRLSSKPKLQLIIATHDPISLSDILNQNVVYVSQQHGKSIIIDSSNDVETKKTFAANISELLADSFFLDGLIGDFALDKINETIKWINKNQSEKGNINTKELSHYKKLISNIDERVIKIKLSEMISELDDSSDFQRQIINEEIRILNAKKAKLK
ncbi:hypothetical protein [Sphingobacterium kitahiroshimense]|uniref:ATPase AAA-type core domain-containing protein n=1 Tax=Sphingobacterium kitahiroshimense TaxID=470446 RepID=A0ABV0BWL3_9SPHI